MTDRDAPSDDRDLETQDRVAALLASTRGRRWVHDRVGRLAATGYDVGADPPDIVEAIEEYLKIPEDWNFGLQQKKLLCRAWELPDEAVNSPLTVGDVIEFTGNLQGVSDEAMDVVRDPKTWRLIKTRGRGGKRETDQIITEVWAERMGVPSDTAFRLTLKQLSDAAVGLQQRGMEGAISRPEFWDAYLGSPNKVAVFDQWQAKLAAEQRIADAQKERETRKAIAELNRAWAAREREWEGLRRQRAEDRQRRIVEEKRRKKRRRRAQATVSTVPDEIRVCVERRVATPWGSNYVLRAYADDTSELIRIEPDGRWVVVLSGRHAYQVSETQSGMLHVVPVIGHRPGRRRASPMDLPAGNRRGPVGID